MTPDPIDDLGPIDYVVVEFPAGQSNFTGEMARELAALVGRGTIRVLDILILQKDDDGAIDALEIDDLDVVDELRELERNIVEILAAKDVAHLAEAMENGSTAGVVVWENRWAAPFGVAARRAGGQLIANGHIPIQAILASLEFDELDPEAEGVRHALASRARSQAGCHLRSRRPHHIDRGRRRRGRPRGEPPPGPPRESPRPPLNRAVPA